MHPIERLRFVARDAGSSTTDVAREAAGALARFADDPIALLTACRRLIDRHPANGAVWWLCARTLLATDPADEPWRCGSDLHADRAVDELADLLPDGATACVVGWPDRLGEALVRRGDVAVRVVDVDGDGPGFARALERADVDAVDVPVTGIGPAVATADVVLLDASAMGPTCALAAPGSWPVASVGRAAGVPVWLVGGLGRTLPAPLWPAVERRLLRPSQAPWSATIDQVPLDLVDLVVTAEGHRTVADALQRPDVPDVPELRR